MIRLFVVAALLLAAPTASFAQGAASTIDMTTVLKGEDGRPAKDALASKEDGAPCLSPATKERGASMEACPSLTLGHAAQHALMITLPDDKLTGEQKWSYGVLAERIKNNPHASLSAAEVTVIKKRLGEIYDAAVLMQAYPLLDPNAKPPEVK